MSDFNLITVDSADIYEQIIMMLENGIREPLYPGDERRIFGEALVQVVVQLFNTVNDAAKQKMLRYARGSVLDALGDRTLTTRLEAKEALTILRFSLDAPILYDVIIPEGTRATADATIYFETAKEVVIKSGSSQVDVDAKSMTGGAINNGYLTGSIVRLVDLIPFVSSVTNLIESYNGDDGEPYTVEGDDHYRERIQIAPSKFSVAGSENAYMYYAKSADPEIIDVSISSPARGEVLIVPLMKNGEIPDQFVLNKVLAAVNQDDIRPLTDYVSVQIPTVVNYDIEIKYYVDASSESIVVENVEGPEGAIEKFRKWQDTSLGTDINPDQLRKLILVPNFSSNPVGASRIDIIKPLYAKVSKTEVAKFSGNLIVTHEVV